MHVVFLPSEQFCIYLYNSVPLLLWGDDRSLSKKLCAQDVGKKGQSARHSAFVYAGIISLVNKIYDYYKNYQLEYVWLIVVFRHFNAFYTYSLLQVLMSICLLLDTYSYNLKHWTKAPTRKSIRIWHVQRTQPIFNSFLTPSLTQ